MEGSNPCRPPLLFNGDRKMMNELFGEFLGTLILILLGNGVVAGVVLPKTKSNSSGWIVITMGWELQLRLQYLYLENLVQLI